MKKTIILDTNFIIYATKYKIDLKKEFARECLFNFEIAVLDKTLVELENLKQNLALNIAKTFRILKTKSSLPVDKILINLSNKNIIIATQDKEIKKQLKGPVAVIRQKKYIKILHKGI